MEITGDAPNELARFQFLRRISAVVPARRVIDRSEVAANVAQAEPAYSLQILRDPEAVSLIGLVPIVPDLPIQDRIAALSPGAQLTNMLERVDRTPPEAWVAALGFGLDALADLERAKLSILPGEVALSGIVADAATLDDLTGRLEQAVPDGVTLVLDLSAPRRVISPFRFHGRSSGGRVEVGACTTESQADAATLTEAARALGADLTCDVGLGAPSTQWRAAAEAVLAALGALTDAEVTLTDTTLQITGLEGQDADAFADAADSLASALPDGFILTSLPPPAPPEAAAPDAPPPVFHAILAKDGAVTLSGDLPDDILRATTESFARAQFGFAAVTNDTAIRDNLPSGWSARVTSGLEALALLREGHLDISETGLEIAGTTTSLQVDQEVRRQLSAAAPQGTDVAVNITIVEETRPVATGIVVPAELCAEQIALILDRNQIIFPPSETEIDATSLPIIDGIAAILQQCPGARFEIGGHTDSQGRESSNLALSQARADSVLTAILDRGAELVFLTTRGYGESDPIAENDTEEGRAQNRRIEFRLITEDDAQVLPEPTEDAGAEVEQEAAEATVDPADLNQDQEAAAAAAAEDDPPEEPAVADQDAAEEPAEEIAEADPPAVEDEAPPEPHSPDPLPEDPPEETPDITPAPRPEPNTSGNILDRPRPRPQRLPQIQEE